jgi:protein ImuA
MIEHNMNNTAKIAELRHSLARYGLPPDRQPIPLGHPQADSVLGGGLRPGALHEVFASGWSASGFAVLLGMLAAGAKPFFWVRPDFEALEYGAVSPNGLAELGGDPRQLILVRTRKGDDALSAASDILGCPHVGALLLEIRGQPRGLDLVASRRLSLAAATSGVSVILLRQSAACEPSAALTRWQVTSAPSRDDDDDWGNPVFDARLVRHRAGSLGNFLMQWDSENAVFREAHPGAVAAAPFHRPADPQIARAV